MHHKLLIGLGIVLAVLLSVEIIALIVIKTSVSRYARYWKTRASEPAESLGGNPFIYVALGDSTAQGIGATSAAKGYVGLIAEQAEQKAGRPVKVINLSTTGAKITDVLHKQLPELAVYKVRPDLVTMEIGANDLPAYNAAAFEDAYSSVLDRLPADETVVSDMPYFGGRVKVSGNDAAASEIIRRQAEGRGIPVAPLYDTLKSRNSPRVYAADYFHPSNYGYTIWSDAFWSKIETRL